METPTLRIADAAGGSRHGGRRSQLERREQAERRMLDAAVRIVADRGLEDLTLTECGEAAGYSRSLAAHYFGSKHGLVRAIAMHIVDDYGERLRARGVGRPGLEGLLERATHYLEADGGRDSVRRRRAFHAVLGSALRQPTLAGPIAELSRRSAGIFAELIRDGIARREIRADVDPPTEGRLILASLRGLVGQWLVDPENVRLDELRRAFLDNLRRSLAA